MHTGAFRSRLRRASVLVALVTGLLAVGVGVAAGLGPGRPAVIPDTAFRPVAVPSDPGMGGPPGLTTAAPSPVLPGAPIPEPVESPAPRPDRPQPALPTAPVTVVPVAPPAPVRPRIATASGSHVLRGFASYYCRAGVSPCTVNHPDVAGVQAYAAAGPKLRAALGSGWRGRIVSVDGIRVKLIDWCQCYQGQPNEKLLDLYYDVFRLTGSPVTIRW